MDRTVSEPLGRSLPLQEASWTFHGNREEKDTSLPRKVTGEAVGHRRGRRDTWSLPASLVAVEGSQEERTSWAVAGNLIPSSYREDLLMILGSPPPSFLSPRGRRNPDHSEEA
jgi:hypothetical protein